MVGHPLDTIKVRMQMAAGGSSVSLAQFGGGLSLLRGIGAPVATAAFVSATSFSTFAYTSRLWDRHIMGDNTKETTLLRNCKNVTSGFIAGIMSCIFLCPSEHVKVRLQAQKSAGTPNKAQVQGAHYRNTLDAAIQITKSHGLAGLYRGMMATCARQGPGFAVYFGAYDPIKEWLLVTGKQDQWVASILAGGTAGSLSWATVYPADLIKSRVQNVSLDASSAERSMWLVAKRVVQETNASWRALYRGLGITVLRAFPVNGIIFCVYEFSLKTLVGDDNYNDGTRHHDTSQPLVQRRTLPNMV